VILGIDHVGLATDDSEGAGTFMVALGMEKADQGVAPAYGVACEFWKYPGRTDEIAIEIVSPIRENCAITGRLGRSGPGLYHIAFIVDNIEGELERLRKKGFSPVDSQPCQGARKGMRVAFMYVPKPAALLIELVQHEPS